jgi:hypothetical protein
MRKRHQTDNTARGATSLKMIRSQIKKNWTKYKESKLVISKYT